MDKPLNSSPADKRYDLAAQSPADGSNAESREVLERLEAARIRRAILEGFDDAINGRTVEYRGNLRALLDRPAVR